MFASENPSIDIADQDSPRKLFPPLENEGFPDLNADEAAIVLENMEKEFGSYGHSSPIENIVAYLKDGFEVTKDPASNQSDQPGLSGRLPGIHEIFGLRNTVANENVEDGFKRGGEKPARYVRKTSGEKKIRKLYCKKSRKTSLIPYEYIAGLAVQNGAQTTPQVYEFVSKHAPVFLKESETWKNSIRQNLSTKDGFFTKEMLPGSRKRFRYSMTSDQVKKFRECYPFDYGDPVAWLRSPPDFEAIYFGKMGFTSSEEEEEWQVEAEQHPIHDQIVSSDAAISGQNGSNYRSSKTICCQKTPEDDKSKTDEAATILSEHFAYLSDSQRGVVEIAPSGCINEEQKSQPISETMYSDGKNFDEVPNATSPLSVNSNWFLSPGSSPSSVNYDTGFEEIRHQEAASSNFLPCDRTDSATPPKQALYNSGESEFPSPMQPLCKEDVCMENQSFPPPKLIPYRSNGEISNDTIHQTKGMNAPIAPQPKEVLESLVAPSSQRTIISRTTERLPGGKLMTRTIYKVIDCAEQAKVIEPSQKTNEDFIHNASHFSNSRRANEHTDISRKAHFLTKNDIDAPVQKMRKLTKANDKEHFILDSKRLESVKVPKTRPRILQRREAHTPKLPSALREWFTDYE